jgi:hypothetical protein
MLWTMVVVIKLCCLNFQIAFFMQFLFLLFVFLFFDAKNVLVD